MPVSDKRLFYIYICVSAHSKAYTDPVRAPNQVDIFQAQEFMVRSLWLNAETEDADIAANCTVSTGGILALHTCSVQLCTEDGVFCLTER